MMHGEANIIDREPALARPGLASHGLAPCTPLPIRSAQEWDRHDPLTTEPPPANDSGEGSFPDPPKFRLSAYRSPRFLAALAFSAAVHIAFFAILLFAPHPKPIIQPPPQVIVLEFATLGKPEAPEAKPVPPPPPPEAKAPEPAPPPETKAPEPLPEIKAQPIPETPPAKAPEPVLPAPAQAKPRPRKPKPPEPPKVETPPTPAPTPEPQAPPVAAAPTPAPAPTPASPPATETPRKGIETGVASGTSQAEMNRYVTTLFTMIDAKKQYPPQSMQRHEEGTVVVRIKIAADGTLIDVTSPTTDPHRLVDASLDAVRKAAPFPALPASLGKSEAEFEVPVNYKLQ